MKEDDLRDKLAEKISKITESGTLKNSEQIIADYILSNECLSMLAEKYEVDEEKVSKVLDLPEEYNGDDLLLWGKVSNVAKALSTAGILKVRT